MPVPAVSIILPTYNRADVLHRALDSVFRQTFHDWELIVVDDGSSDETPELFRQVDPRIRYLRQDNRGVYAARNHGLREARGRYLTFLDSDDEWLPHYLALTTGFLDHSPDDQFVMTELWVDYGNNQRARIYRDALPKFMAYSKFIDVGLRDLPIGETDDYLRIYESREAIGAWGDAIAAAAGFPDAQLYRGNIFRHYRWGYLGWLPTTMLRREALDRVGPFPEDYRTTADYRFLAILSREFRANMIAVPSAVKHQHGAGGQALKEDHLAVGASEYRFAVNQLRLFDELYWQPNPDDVEIRRIRSLHQLFAGRKALALGKRNEALEHLTQAARANPRLRVARWLRRFLLVVPSAPLAHRLYRLGVKSRDVARSLLAGDITLLDLLHKVGRRLLPIR